MRFLRAQTLGGHCPPNGLIGSHGIVQGSHNLSIYTATLVSASPAAKAFM